MARLFLVTTLALRFSPFCRLMLGNKLFTVQQKTGKRKLQKFYRKGTFLVLLFGCLAQGSVLSYNPDLF